MMTGAAGTGLFQLALWEACSDKAALERAKGEAHMLLESRDKAVPVWTIPPDHEGLSGNEYIGFSHGSAGIGYFLAEYCLAQRDTELESCCGAIADWIVEQARPCLRDESGMTWPMTKDGEGGCGANWCHGSAGIARFLTRASDLLGKPIYLAAAKKAGRMLAAGMDWNGTTQCHGLAGNADVLVDIWHRTGGEELEAARRLGAHLVAYRSQRGWPSESHDVFTTDFMVGQSGVGAAFIRLGNPNVPHLVSSKWVPGASSQ
jgi:lantibiotic modifying enzyme